MNTHRLARTAVTSALVLFGMGLLIPMQASGMANRPARSPIYIGQIASASGLLPAQNPFKVVRGMPGALLALRQINKHGGINGRPLKLILADDHSTSEGGVAAFRRLTQIDHVTAIIGPGSPPEILAMTPDMKRAKIPMIIGGSPYKTTRLGNPWIFRTRPTDIYQDRALTTFAVTTLHLSKIALMVNDDAAGKDAEAMLRADLKALGVTPVAELTWPVMAADLTAQVLAIKKSGAKALISVSAEPADFRLLARQMREVGLHLTWLGNPILALAAALPGAELLHGTYSATDYVATKSPEAAAFDRAMEAAFHIPAGFPDAYTYDGMQILARVMREVGTNGQAIRRGILAIRGCRGAEGTYNFDRNGDGLHQYTIVQNVKGHLRVIKVLSL
jgi:branched-chain amino acid transport system substrate-binding protein